MLMGRKFRAYPTVAQQKIISQWIDAGIFVWNAKTQQYHYERTFARKYMPIGTYASIDQTYSQFKNQELSPFLYEVPSQILRNSAANWYFTMQGFLKGKNGCARAKKYKTGKRSVHLTNELFKFIYHDNGTVSLIIGTAKYPFGELRFKVCST